LSFIQTIDPEGRRSNPQRELNRVGTELRKAEVCIVVYPDDVATAQLDFRPPVRSAIKLVAFVERKVQCRVGPVVLRIVRPLVVDLAFYQTDAGDVNQGIIDGIVNGVIKDGIIKDGIIGQNRSTEGHQRQDHYHHHWPDIGAATGEIISEFVKEPHTILRGQNSKKLLTKFLVRSETDSFYSGLWRPP
jgi:hypothetical protein